MQRRNEVKSVKKRAMNLHIIGLRITLQKRKGILRFCFWEEDGDLFAVLRRGRLLCWRGETRTSKITRIARRIGKVRLRRKYALTLDYAEALRLLRDAESDKKATILNVINVFDDVEQSLSIALPEREKRVLHPLANYLTVDTDLTALFQSSAFSRGEAIEAIQRALGAILAEAWLV